MCSLYTGCGEIHGILSRSFARTLVQRDPVRILVITLSEREEFRELLTFYINPIDERIAVEYYKNEQLAGI